MLKFLNPYFLPLLIIVLIMLFFYIKKDKLAGPSISFSNFISTPPKSFKNSFYHILFGLKILAFTCLIISISRPVLVTKYAPEIIEEKKQKEGIDIIFCMDISSSMKAMDFKPNRLEKSKIISNDFIKNRVNDRIGIVVYAGESFALCPLTTDYSVLNSYMSKLGESSQYNLEDGTSIGLGIATSILRLQKSDAKSKIIILLTDGMNNDALDNVDPITASLIAKENNIKIYTIGVGSMGTAPYPMQDVFGREVIENIEVEIDEDLLQNIAKETNARYFRATDGEKLLEIYNEIENLEKSKIEEVVYTYKKDDDIEEIYMIFSIISIASLFLYLFIKHTYLRKIF